jgi:hypothetical protein
MRISMVFAGLVAFSAVACGGSSSDGNGGGSTTVSTSIPEDTKGSDLTQAQTNELCDAAAAAAKAAFPESEIKPTMCGFLAWSQASLFNMPGKCQDFYNQCLKAPQDSDGDSNVEETGECTQPSSACSATVGEIEACISDTLAQSKAMLAKLPGCDDVGTEFSEEDLGSDESPASCKVVEEKCPEALESNAVPELPGIAGDSDVEDNSAPSAPGSNG